MIGHATPEELNKIAELERQFRAGRSSPIEDLELALYYLEPCHSGTQAMELLRNLVARKPGEPMARAWLAYCALHYTMDLESLRLARALLEESIGFNGTLGAAASLLLPQVERELEDASQPREIELLQHSVHLCPNWVFNHHLLALAYAAVNRRAEAVEHLERAKGNVVSIDPAWNHLEREFEIAITGRASHAVKQRLEHDLEKLRTAAS
jgi:tetratricopeptide (TPR) repeat protein